MLELLVNLLHTPLFLSPKTLKLVLKGANSNISLVKDKKACWYINSKY